MIVTLNSAEPKAQNNAAKADSKAGKIFPGCIVEVRSSADHARDGDFMRLRPVRGLTMVRIIYAQVAMGDGIWDIATVTVSPLINPRER